MKSIGENAFILQSMHFDLIIPNLKPEFFGRHLFYSFPKHPCETSFFREGKRILPDFRKKSALAVKRVFF